MPTHRLTAASLAAFVVLLACAGAAHADTYASAKTEYTRRIQVGETIQPLGETPFGESVSLYTGNLSFRQTDISLPGIGPDITLTRTYEVTGSPVTGSFDLPMGDWDLAVPEIATMIPAKRMGYGGVWNVNYSAAPTARCSHITMVSQAPFGFGLPWWHGYQLVTGDGNSQPLLKRTAENTLAPGGNTAAYPILTPGNWVLGCLSSTSNGMPGEGFLGVAPDGTRYWFDHLAYGAMLETLIEIVPEMNDPNDPIDRESLLSGGDAVTTSEVVPDGMETDVYYGTDILQLKRQAAHMFATRVEDRFGNWVSYRYIGTQLQEINASDGRRVLVVWRTDAPLVDRITVMPGTEVERTWRYEYESPTDPLSRTLVRVVQPDDTAWDLTTVGASSVKLPSVDPDGMCGTRTFTQIPSDDNVVGITMYHPSGLKGDFMLSLRAHARSWVPTTCSVTPSSFNEHLPPVYLSLSLTSKTFSGPGVQPRTWQYRYSPARGSTLEECTAAPCQDWQWVEVTDPELSTTHYRYSTRWGYTEGKLLAKVDGVTQTGTEFPDGLQKETYTYADPERTWQFPSRLGEMLQDRLSFSNVDNTERLAPEVLRDKRLQGVSFQREVSTFDRFGNPEAVRRASVPGDSRTETMTYWPVDSQWVIGQPWKTSVGSRVISQTDYDAKVLPRQVYSFGLLQATLGYAPNGMLSSITDGRNNTTTLSEHKRGMAQLIRFPDTTSVRTSVDDLGQVRSVLNQLSDTTGYTYDLMGRITRVDYTDKDTIAWNPVDRTFTRPDQAAYGLPWGYWRQEVRTGTALTTTLYDVLWRPRMVISEDTARPGSRSYVVKRFDSAGREIYSSYPVDTAPFVDDNLPGVITTYDPLGRVQTVTQSSELGPLTTRHDYLTGFRTRLTNPRNFATTTSYQTFDEPSEAAPVRIEAPEGVTTVIDRDMYGKPLAITRSGPAN